MAHVEGQLTVSPPPIGRSAGLDGPGPRREVPIGAGNPAATCPTMRSLSCDRHDEPSRKRAYRFRLMVQPRTDPAAMPLDQATVEWPERLSPSFPSARWCCRARTSGTRTSGVWPSLSFNIWRVPKPSPVPILDRRGARAVYAAAPRHATSRTVSHSLIGYSRVRPRAVEAPDACIVRR